MTAMQYPFAEKKEHYRGMSDCQLIWVLDDARKAWENQEEIEREIGPHHHSGKNSGWRADDFHTILSVMNERKFSSIGKCNIRDRTDDV